VTADIFPILGIYCLAAAASSDEGRAEPGFANDAGAKPGPTEAVLREVELHLELGCVAHATIEPDSFCGSLGISPGPTRDRRRDGG